MADPDSTNQPTAVFTAAYEVTAWYDADNAVTARDAVESGVRLDLPGLVRSSVDEWRFSHAKPENVFSAELQVTVRFEAHDEPGARQVAEKNLTVSMPGLLSQTVTLREVRRDTPGE
jgi:hypothetical protein